MKSRGLTKRNLLVAAAAVAALAVYILFCEYSGAMPRCPFKWVTELDCPGCGSQRALHSLLHGHPMDAWGYNLILPPVVIYLMALVLLPLWGDRRAERIHAALTSPAAIWSLLGVVMAWWVLRNLPLMAGIKF